MSDRTIEPEDREALLRGVRLSYWKILKRLDKTLESSSLSARQYLLLDALGTNGPMNARRLGEALAVTPADVTGLTARLERKGLVRRLRSESDRRLVILELTDAGAKAVEAARRDRDRLVDSLITSMTPNEFRMMLRGLSRIIGSAGPGTELAPPDVIGGSEAPTAPRKRRALSRRAPNPDVR